MQSATRAAQAYRASSVHHSARAQEADFFLRVIGALCAAIALVGMSVQRGMDRDLPDFDFLIAVNQNIAAISSSSDLISLASRFAGLIVVAEHHT